VEDQLNKIYGKKIYTKLDKIERWLHQIAIHSDCTKFFSFATPSGQYEYKKLLFGFSELPAEFQKRVNDIFKDLVRSNKVQLYIDDILIATTNFEENLKF